MIRILHISDFHYEGKNLGEYKDFVQKLCDAVKDKGIDLIVFSGDLIYDGKSEKAYNEVKDLLFTPLLKTTGLTTEKLLIVPGNHDVDRDKELPVITNGLAKCLDWHSLDSFLQNERQAEMSFERMEQYLKFATKFYNNTSFKTTRFYTVATCQVNDKKIGLLGLNSAWRCFDSEKDRANQLFSKSELYEAIETLEGCDINICSMHHDIHDFKDFVMQDIEDIIFEKCHLLLTGHYHNARTSLHQASEIGLLHYSAPATINLNDKYSTYGFAIIDVDDTYTVQIQTYFKEGNDFIPGKKDEQDLPMCEEKKKANVLRRRMRKRHSILLKKADDLFVTGYDVEENKEYSFAALFGNPIIKDKSAQEILANKSKGKNYSLHEILQGNDDYILFGLDKCGKTSLLWKLMLDAMADYDHLLQIPILINCDDYRTSKKLNIKAEIATILESNSKTIASILQRYTLLILLDDLNIKNKEFIEELNRQLKEYSNVRIIASAEETISSLFGESVINSHKLKKLYIHSITIKEIHSLTVKWPNLSVTKKKQFEEKIVQIFEQMHIPFNYWTASLFLWILEKTDESNIHNNFELVKLYIDELLHRKGIVRYQELNLQYDDLLTYLGCLAEFMLGHYNESYSITYAEWVSFTEHHIQTNRKYTETVENTINVLLRFGVIYESSVGMYTFRLKGVFEFFNAYQMTRNQEFYNKIRSERNFYLSYGNEFELYAGFKKDDVEFVKFIFNKTKEIFKPVTDEPDYEYIDDRLSDEVISLARTLKASQQLLEKAPTIADDEDEDDYFPMVNSVPLDTSKVEQKKFYETIEPNITNLEKALFILSRVYRNSNICNYINDSTADDIMNFILTGSCNIGIRFLSKLEEDMVEDKDTARGLMSAVLQFMPIVMQAFLYDAMAQNNLVRVFTIKLEELKQNPKGNEFKIFLLTFILIDLDIDKHLCLLDDLDKYITKGALVYGIHCKISILAYKYYDSKPILDDLLKRAETISKKIKDGKNHAQILRNSVNEYKLQQLAEKKSRDLSLDKTRNLN